MRMGPVLQSMARISRVLLVVTMMGGCEAKRASSADLSEWERVKRVTVHNSPRRSRYPSIARAGDGALLVLFMRQTAEQETAGQGDLVLARSTDEGQSWSDAEIVYTGREGEPRAVGTITILNSGRIIAPFAEFGEAQTTSRFRLLSSEDNGKRWQVNDPSANVPLIWWAPCGRVIEISDGTLIVPVYGAASQTDLKATIHNCGLLRSRDGGESWGDFSWIAQGGSRMVGAAAISRFSFEGPSVQPLPDGRWLALVTARRLNRTGDGPTAIDEGPGTPQALCRMWSSDEGRTWTNPNHLMPGAWPGVAVAGPDVLCANTLWCGWGEIRLQVSRNGFETFYQGLNAMQREWTRGMVNRPQETPLPPTVPYLAKQWPYEHYGYPSALALDQDNLVVVFADEQRGTEQIDGEKSMSIPWDQERIQAVFYSRRSISEELAEPLPSRPRPRGRWVLAERIIVPNINGQMTQMPSGDLVAPIAGKFSRSSDGGRTWKPIEGINFPGDGHQDGMGFLNSGRWLIAVVTSNQPWSYGGHTEMGLVGGYRTFKREGQAADRHITFWHSDDQGKTWTDSKPFKGPFKWVSPSVSHFIESDDGSIALPVFGCVTDEEMGSYSSSNGVVRSHDGGKTWGDFSFVFRTQPPGPDDYQPEPRYSEMDIAQLPNGHGVAFSRNERITMGPAGWGSTKIALSTDLGRTWRRTGGSLQGVSQQKGVVLPDGGVALAWRAHSWQGSGVAITYDEGRSFDYLLTGPYETVNAFMHGTDEFVVYTSKSHRSDSSAGVYRWVPN